MNSRLQVAEIDVQLQRLRSHPKWEILQAARRKLAEAQLDLLRAEAAWAEVVKPLADARAAASGRCQASRDGDCSWSGCPQLLDGEPGKSGRCCPLPAFGDEDF